MSPADILAAVTASPALQALLPDTMAIAAALSVGTRVESPRMVSARGLAGKYAGGAIAAEVVLMKLEGARDAMLASADAQQKVFGSLLRRQLGFLASDGLDFGDATLRGMLDQFAGMGLITAAEATHLKALGEVPDLVSERDVEMAIRFDDGTLRI